MLSPASRAPLVSTALLSRAIAGEKHIYAYFKHPSLKLVQPVVPHHTRIDPNAHHLHHAPDRFDPLNLAKDKETLLQFRAAEIKHARLATLAAAGWPLAEVWDKSLANLIGADSPIADNGGLVRACAYC